MQSLMQTLASKEPFYVRCIKPNEAKSPSAFDDKRVEHQIRSDISSCCSRSLSDKNMKILKRKNGLHITSAIPIRSFR